MKEAPMTEEQNKLAVREGESRWLIERTYAKGHPAERREFWLGATPNDMFHDSFDSNGEVWTINALEAARFSSQKIAETLRYRHFHPEAPVEACEHLFQCGITPEREPATEAVRGIMSEVTAPVIAAPGAFNLSEFVNAADIGGADSPHQVVYKLQRAINATLKGKGASQK